MDFNKQQKVKELPSDLIFIARVAKVSDHSKIKILTLKPLLQILLIAPSQVKAGNTSENLLNEIRQIIYYLCGEKEANKKVYNNIKDSIKL